MLRDHGFIVSWERAGHSEQRREQARPARRCTVVHCSATGQRPLLARPVPAQAGRYPACPWRRGCCFQRSSKIFGRRTVCCCFWAVHIEAVWGLPTDEGGKPVLLADVWRDGLEDLLRLLRRCAPYSVHCIQHFAHYCLTAPGLRRSQAGRYKLRAKVDLADVSSEFAVWVQYPQAEPGLEAGRAAPPPAGAGFSQL